MATDRGGGVVDGRARRFQARILVPGWNPNPDANLFSLIFVYKLTSTNSYNTNCIIRIHTIRTFFIQIVYYEFIQFLHFVYKLYTTNSYNKARAKPEHTSCPDQALQRVNPKLIPTHLPKASRGSPRKASISETRLVKSWEARVAQANSVTVGLEIGLRLPSENWDCTNSSVWHIVNPIFS
jgi:hypothetical protein